MAMVYTKKKIGIANLCIVYVFILFGCMENNSFHTGEQLDEYNISEELDSMVDYVISNLEEKHTCDLVMELMKSDTLLSIDITLQNRSLINKYIYYYNRRVVGFVKKEEDSIIILSNINSMHDLGNTFGRYLHPTRRKGKFRHLQIPLSLYDAQNTGGILDEEFDNDGNWGDIPYMYEPSVFSFVIRGDSIIFPTHIYRR